MYIEQVQDRESIKNLVNSYDWSGELKEQEIIIINKPENVSLPFVEYPIGTRHSNSIGTESEIDYDSFVVQVKEVGEMRETLEKLFRNHTEIQRLQLNLMKNSQYFLYGMGDDRHLHEDAFAKILQSLEMYSSLLQKWDNY